MAKMIYVDFGQHLLYKCVIIIISFINNVILFYPVMFNCNIIDCIISYNNSQALSCEQCFAIKFLSVQYSTNIPVNI